MAITNAALYAAATPAVRDYARRDEVVNTLKALGYKLRSAEVTGRQSRYLFDGNIAFTRILVTAHPETGVQYRADFVDEDGNPRGCLVHRDGVDSILGFLGA